MTVVDGRRRAASMSGSDWSRARTNVDRATLSAAASVSREVLPAMDPAGGHADADTLGSWVSSAPWMASVARRVLELSHLEPNWDSHGGSALDDDVCAQMFGTLIQLHYAVQREPRMSLTPLG